MSFYDFYILKTAGNSNLISILKAIVGITQQCRNMNGHVHVVMVNMNCMNNATIGAQLVTEDLLVG